MGISYDIGTCVDCHTRRVVRHLEWLRAAVPRCHACGGRLEPAAAAYAEHIQQGDIAKTLSAKKIKGGHIVT